MECSLCVGGLSTVLLGWRLRQGWVVEWSIQPAIVYVASIDYLQWYWPQSPHAQHSAIRVEITRTCARPLLFFCGPPSAAAAGASRVTSADAGSLQSTVLSGTAAVSILQVRPQGKADFLGLKQCLSSPCCEHPTDGGSEAEELLYLNGWSNPTNGGRRWAMQRTTASPDVVRFLPAQEVHVVRPLPEVTRPERCATPLVSHPRDCTLNA